MTKKKKSKNTWTKLTAPINVFIDGKEIENFKYDKQTNTITLKEVLYCAVTGNAP